MLTTMLAYQGLRTHALPISSAAELLLSIAWGLSGLALFLDLTFTHRLPTWVIAGATTACLVAAAFLGVVGQPTDLTDKPLIVIHVGAAVLAYCVLGAQALNSAAYLLQDRALARRVSAHLKRWKINADDSAGVPLSTTPPGMLLLTLATAAADDFAPVPLLALLKHPLVTGGMERLD